jgi:hypothetical protein
VSSLASRALLVVGIAITTAAASWWAWPRPALLMRVDRGGRAFVVDRWGRRRPLPETLYVAATGRDTRVRIDNRDTTYQTLGIFGAAAGTVRSFSVPLPGTYGGFCSAHASSGQITYVVQ